MPATASPTAVPPPRGRARVPLVVAGAFTTLLAAVLLGLGALALWADGEKDQDGYLTTGSHAFTTQTAALATDDLDVDLDGVDPLVDVDDLGRIKLRVESRDDRPVFVGIAPAADVDAYLGGVRHDRVEDVATAPFEADLRRESGARTIAPPSEQDIWATASSGKGPRELTWDAADGAWSVVVMNTDGTPGVRADVEAGAKAPFLAALGWSSLGGGVLMLAASGGLLALALRPRRRTGSRGPAEAQVVTATR